MNPGRTDLQTFLAASRTRCDIADRCKMRAGLRLGSKIDREWPYQVALRADQVAGKDYSVTHDFCRGLSLCPRGHTVRRKNITYAIFCFADLTHGDLFRERSDGERFDPKERGRGNEWFLWWRR